jgi:hypothetical protein
MIKSNDETILELHVNELKQTGGRADGPTASQIFVASWLAPGAAAEGAAALGYAVLSSWF